ncbi:MAG: efflux RND transporter periplasmic adaptor subunit [Enhygromyxa sp.]
MLERPRLLALGLALAGLLACAPEPIATPEPERRAKPDARTQPSVPEPGYVAVVVPVRSVDIAPAITGELTSVLVWAGDRVAAGDVLAVLDDGRLRDELVITEAELRRQRAALRRARLDEEQSRAAATQLDVLAEGGHVSENERSEASFAAERGAASAEQADAAVAESRARIAQMRRQLDDSSIVAPFDGVVAKRYLDEGAVTGPNLPILRLIAGQTPWVRFAVEPSEIDELELGERVRVRFEDGDELRATIRQIAPEVDPATELVFVEAALDEGQRAIAIGTAAVVLRGT